MTGAYGWRYWFEGARASTAASSAAPMALTVCVSLCVGVWFRALAANVQNMALAQRHAEALIWQCLEPSAVAEPESCFARLRQSPEPANKNKFSEIVWRHPLDATENNINMKANIALDSRANWRWSHKHITQRSQRGGNGFKNKQNY